MVHPRQSWLTSPLANQPFITMKTIALALAASVAATPAIAGPYTTTKSEFKGQGDGYKTSIQQARVGYEHEVGQFKPYVEVGGGIVTPHQEDTLGLIAVQVGTKFRVNENLTGKLAIENLHYDGKNKWKGVISTKYKF